MNIAPPCSIQCRKGEFVLRYNVYFCDSIVGVVDLKTEGLYYQIECQCRIFTDDICRLEVFTEKGRIALGVFVREGAKMVLKKRVSVKILGTDIFGFYVYLNEEHKNIITFDLEDNMAFPYISMLEHAKLCSAEGKTVVRLVITQP